MIPTVPSPPSISVVIPARNEEGCIGAALQSFLDQDGCGNQLECIVVDNASIDGTARVVQELQRGHTEAPIQLVAEDRLGPAAAKNTGARAAQGDVLIFADADSRMAPNLAREVAMAYQSGHPLGSIRVVADGGAWVDRAFFNLMEFGKTRMGVRAQMLFCQRALFLAAGGFDPNLRLGEDVDFLRRARRHLRRTGQSSRVIHLATSEIRTSTRRLTRRHHLGTLLMFWRWLLAFVGLGRRRPY